MTQDSFSSCAPKQNERHFYLMIMDTGPNTYCWQLSNYNAMRCCSQQPEQNLEWLKSDCTDLGCDLPHSTRKLLQLLGSLHLIASPSGWDPANSSEVKAEAWMLHCVSMCAAIALPSHLAPIQPLHPAGRAVSCCGAHLQTALQAPTILSSSSSVVK